MIKAERGFEVTRSWGQRELIFNGYRVSTWNDKKFWKWIVIVV
jgi:hypothetical protein